MNTNELFTIVSWPESQQFIGTEYAFFISDEKVGSSTYAVQFGFYKFGMDNPNLYGEELEKEYEKSEVND